MKTCPYCEEEIQDSAKKCRFCGERLNDDSLEQKNGFLEKNIIEDKINNTRKQISNPDFIKNFIENNKNEKGWFVKYIIRLLRFLYCDKNRISGIEFFIGYLRLRLMTAIHYGPISFLLLIVSSSFEYTEFGSFLNFINIVLLLIISLLFVGVRVKQIISRWHDLGLSGWYGFLNILSPVTVILFFIPGQKGKNMYGE